MKSNLPAKAGRWPVALVTSLLLIFGGGGLAAASESSNGAEVATPEVVATTPTVEPAVEAAPEAAPAPETPAVEAEAAEAAPASEVPAVEEVTETTLETTTEAAPELQVPVVPEATESESSDQDDSEAHGCSLPIMKPHPADPGVPPGDHSQDPPSDNKLREPNIQNIIPQPCDSNGKPVPPVFVLPQGNGVNYTYNTVWGDTHWVTTIIATPAPGYTLISYDDGNWSPHVDGSYIAVMRNRVVPCSNAPEEPSNPGTPDPGTPEPGTPDPGTPGTPEEPSNPGTPDPGTPEPGVPNPTTPETPGATETPSPAPSVPGGGVTPPSVSESPSGSPTPSDSATTTQSQLPESKAPSSSTEPGVVSTPSTVTPQGGVLAQTGLNGGTATAATIVTLVGLACVAVASNRRRQD